MTNEIFGLRPPTLQPAQVRPVPSAPVGTQPSAGNGPATADTVTLTDSGRLMQRLEAAVAGVPQVDAQRVARIKAQIANGAYPLHPERLAAQVVRFEQQMPRPEHDFDFARTENGYTWNLTSEMPHGTRERSVTVSIDPETQTITRDITVTRADGEQVTRHGSIERTEDGFTKHSTTTGPNGETISRSVDLRYDEGSATWTRVAVHDGVHHDFKRTSTHTRDGDADAGIHPIDPQPPAESV